jgi:hypothetical protein
MLYARRRSGIVAAPRLSRPARDSAPSVLIVCRILESPSMHGVCRLLWSLIILASLGCQSTPQGSTGLAGRLSDVFSTPAKPPAQGEGLAALISSRLDAGRTTQQTQTASNPDRDAQDAQNQDRQTGHGKERADVDVTAGARQAQTLDLMHPAGNDVPGGRSDSRWAGHGDLSAPVPAVEQSREEESVQQIILTRRPGSESDTQLNGMSSSVTPTGSQSELTKRPHPLADEPVRLAAPEPGGGRRSPAQQSAPVVTVSEEQTTVAAVYDAFGVGGESLAAQQELAETSRIGLAGRSTFDAPDTQAEAIARDLGAEKASPSVYWQEDLDKLITLLEAQVAQQKPGNTEFSRDQYIRQHVALRMLYLIASRQPEALQAIPAVSHDQQEFWTRMFWALASIFDEEAMPNSTVRAAETVAQLRAAIRQIEPRASLELSGTLFCRRIDGFGDFVPFEEGPLAPGQPVLIYTEVRNFQSQLGEDGSYSTRLRTSITIQQESVSGPVVFRFDLPESEDRCQSRRRDYFHSYRIHLPETLKQGPHVLTLDVTDTLTGKNGSTTLNFVVR